MMKLRYSDQSSPFHSLSPLCKLAWVVSISASSFILDHPVFLLLLFLSTLPSVAAAGIWRKWSSFMKYSLYLCLTIIAVNVLVSYHGTHILWQFPFRIPLLGTPTVTLEAIFFGAGMSLRLLTLISAFAILTLTVHPDDIIQVLFRIKVPYKSVLVTSLSTRFIPTLIDDARRIGDIQRSRGLELDRGNLFRRIKNHTAVLVPLLSNSLDRTVQVAEAMEARAFGSGAKRTFHKGIKLYRPDVLLLIIIFLSITLAIVIRFFGIGDYHYYPTLEKFGFNALEWYMLTVLFILQSLIAPLAILRKRLELD